MANRNFMSGGKLFSMHKDPVMLDCTIQIGATGAVSSYVGSCIQSVARQSAGVYKITFQPQTNFPRVLAANGTAMSPASGNSGITAVEVQNAPNASVSPVASPSITVKCLGATDASTTTLINKDPANGSALNILLIMGNSSVTIQGE